MGCPCEIGVFSSDPELAENTIGEAENEVHRLDQKYSHFNDSSYICHLQADARRGQGTKTDAETAALLNYAAKQFELSDGLFDITAGQLSRLWHQRESLPASTEINDALISTGWEKLVWQNQYLSLPANMQIELGGLVKEYAADRAALILKRNKMNSAFIELGGDIHVTGPHPDGKPWNMGIRKPDYDQSENHQAIASIPISSGGLATSGDYERSSLIDGIHYGHIINPKTGWPVSNFQSVSVLAPSCLLAGSMSTLVMLMEPEAGLVALQDCGLNWLAQTTDGVIHSSNDELSAHIAVN